jgi:hypothetical protein
MAEIGFDGVTKRYPGGHEAVLGLGLVAARFGNPRAKNPNCSPRAG